MGKHSAVFFTALDTEYSAVRSHLRALREDGGRSGSVYEQGDFDAASGVTWSVALVAIGKGNARAAMETERAILHFEPQAVFFVGVAGGIKDVKLGDVVAADRVYYYESGKDTGEFLPRPDVGECSYDMIQRARAEARKPEWLKRLTAISDTSPTVHVGPIAAGEKVVASVASNVARFIADKYSDALAVEMEGRGFLVAAHANHGVRALVVRGISDLLSGKSQADAQGYQQIAAANASAFAFEVLSRLALDPGRVKYYVLFAGDVTDYDRPKVDALLRLLAEVTRDPKVEFVELEAGSVRLWVRGSLAGLERLNEVHARGQLSSALGAQVLDVGVKKPETEVATATVRILIGGSHPWPALAGDNEELVRACASDTSPKCNDYLLWVGSGDCRPKNKDERELPLKCRNLVPGAGFDHLAELAKVRNELKDGRVERVQVVVFAPLLYRDGDWYVCGVHGDAVMALDLTEILLRLLGDSGVRRAAVLFHRSRSWPARHGTRPVDFPDDRALDQIENALRGSGIGWTCRLTGQTAPFQLHELKPIPRNEGFDPITLEEILDGKPSFRDWNRAGAIVLLAAKAIDDFSWPAKLSLCVGALGMRVEWFDNSRVQAPGLLVVFEDTELLRLRAGSIEGMAVVLLGQPSDDARNGDARNNLRLGEDHRGEGSVLEQALLLHAIKRGIMEATVSSTPPSQRRRNRDSDHPPARRANEATPRSPQAEDFDRVTGICERLIVDNYDSTLRFLETLRIPRDPEHRKHYLMGRESGQPRFTVEFVRALALDLSKGDKAFTDRRLTAAFKELLDCLAKLLEAAPKPIESASLMQVYVLAAPDGVAGRRFNELWHGSEEFVPLFGRPGSQQGFNEGQLDSSKCAVVVIERGSSQSDGEKTVVNGDRAATIKQDLWSLELRRLRFAAERRKKIFVGIENGAEEPEELQSLLAARHVERMRRDSIAGVMTALLDALQLWRRASF